MNDITIKLTTTTHGMAVYPQYKISYFESDIDVFRIDEMGLLYETYPQLSNKNFMHAHNFDMIIWIKKGTGVHCVDFKEYSVEDNTIFFLSSYNLHQLSPTEKADGYVIAFTPDFLNHLDPSVVNKIRHILFNRRNGANYCKVTPYASEELQHIVNRMEEEQNLGNNKHLHNTYNAILLMDFIICVVRYCQWSKSDSISNNNQYSEIYSKFIEAVDDNYATKHTVKDYVLLLGVSKNVLTKSTKLYEQLTPLEIIDDRIIIEAKRLLACTTLRIKEISSKLGFEDPSYFNKFFKKIVKITPADFRERY